MYIVYIRCRSLIVLLPGRLLLLAFENRMSWQLKVRELIYHLKKRLKSICTFFQLYSKLKKSEYF